jgi:hypothetical protein
LVPLAARCRRFVNRAFHSRLLIPLLGDLDAAWCSPVSPPAQPPSRAA